MRHTFKTRERMARVVGTGEENAAWVRIVKMTFVEIEVAKGTRLQVGRFWGTRDGVAWESRVDHAHSVPFAAGIAPSKVEALQAVTQAVLQENRKIGLNASGIERLARGVLYPREPDSPG